MPGFQTLFDPSQENLETRLAEAEAYQKILEQQLKVFVADLKHSVAAIYVIIDVIHWNL